MIDGKRLVARQREMKYNAGVLKTFDEIIVNSVDRQVDSKQCYLIGCYIRGTCYIRGICYIRGYN